MTREDFDIAVERAATAVLAQFAGEPPHELMEELREVIADVLREWVEVDGG